ncbi:hypothetical protein CIK76_09115 [Glutamicibacter sp. BW80]|nr:hypothetical protein CIK76_09115 [Glutamicibacter sp. BW80]
MPMGLKVFVAACFSVGSIFTGAHGLLMVSLLATAFALTAPITIPFGIVALLAAIPAVIWFAFWVGNREFIQRS